MEQKIDFSDFDFAILPELKAGETLIIKFPDYKYPVDEMINVLQSIRDFYLSKGVEIIAIPKDFDIEKKD